LQPCSRCRPATISIILSARASISSAGRQWALPASSTTLRKERASWLGQSFLVATLKRGSLYVLPLTADGKAAAGHFSRYFRSENRYRDTAVSPDGRTIYIATDPGGLAEALSGGSTRKMQNPGAILTFTYAVEGTGVAAGLSGVNRTSVVDQPGTTAGDAQSMAPQFTAEQAEAGKTAFDSNCAVCHGNTTTSGTFGPPLAGEYFRNKWVGQTVRAFYDDAKTMPPSAPASLQDETYADIVAYVLEVNGFRAAHAKLSHGGDALAKMTIR
jgi:mono/diheme cytochrome c family protein